MDSLEHRLQTLFPGSWRVERRQPTSCGVPQPDAIFTIRGPDGASSLLVIEAKRHLDPKDISMVAAELRSYGDHGPGMVVAPYLSQRSRQLLADQGIAYADATGNLRLELVTPATFLLMGGSDYDPWREARPLHSLKGSAAGRVVRALCEFRPPYGIRELAQRSRTSAPSVSRVVTLLDRDALLTRGRRGEIMAVQWPNVIRRWVEDYALLTSNRVYNYLEPRSHTALVQKLRGVGFLYAVTGSLAAARLAPIAASRLGVVYVERAELAAEHLGLRSAETGANVLLAEPYNPVVFDRTEVEDGITFAAPVQVAADLLTSPGRGPAEGEALLKWMDEHENAWRH